MEPETIRSEISNLNYLGIHNPVDGVFYPGVSLEIPSAVKEEHEAALHEIAGPFESCLSFLRLSLKGTPQPHQVHTDGSMADLTCITYLTPQEFCQGGTSVLTHDETGKQGDPFSEEEIEIWKRDSDDVNLWSIDSYYAMRFNATAIFDSRRFHRAEPVGGFGSSFEDGRLVLVSFLRMKD